MGLGALRQSLSDKLSGKLSDKLSDKARGRASPPAPRAAFAPASLVTCSVRLAPNTRRDPKAERDHEPRDARGG